MSKSASECVIDCEPASRVSDSFVDALSAKKRAWGFRIFSILIDGTEEEVAQWSDRSCCPYFLLGYTHISGGRFNFTVPHQFLNNVKFIFLGLIVWLR